MFNNPVLDVAIGLCFIYVLYSLLATTIKEFIATFFSYRGRMLERGLEQMLDGENHRYFWWNKWVNAVRSWLGKAPAEGSRAYRKAKLFTRVVTSHPLYKRSSENSLLSKKPAYLSSDTFSDILIDIFSPASGRPVLLRDIASAITRKANDDNDPFKPEAARILNIFIGQANGDLQRFKSLVEGWYDDTMGRVSGWYKRQASEILFVIGFLLAAVFNVSTVEMIQKLSTDKTARDAMVKSATAYVNQHANDPNLKAPTTTATVSNANQSTILSGPSASSALQNQPAPVQPHTVGLAATQPPQPEKPDLKADTGGKHQDVSFADAQAKIQAIKSLYSNSIEQQNTTLGLGWKEYGYLDDSTKWAKDSLAHFESIAKWNRIYYFEEERRALFLKDINNASSSISKAAKDSSKIYGDKLAISLDSLKASLNKRLVKKPIKKNILGQIWFVIVETFTDPIRLIGFLITALAISLGAPFWFDLLNKFVNLRVSGQKPDTSNPAASKTPTLNQKPSPNSFA